MKIAHLIDQTNIKSEAKQDDIDKLVQEAHQHHFFSICVNTSWVEYAKSKLDPDCPTKVVSVTGFPLGANLTEAKVFEANLAIKKGAEEIDMVMHIGKFKSQDYAYVLNDINQVKEAIQPKVLKVIIETGLLTVEEIQKAATIIQKSKADFIKTSTGFFVRGASFEDIKIIKKVVKDELKIKAAGGIKNLEDLKTMVNLGASRIGTSSGVQLVNKQKVTTKY